MGLLIIGSVAFDSITTPTDQRTRIIGGSGVHAGIAASFFSPVELVGVVGGDWPESNTELLRRHKIDTRGLEIRSNEKTLYWSGRYFDNLNERETLEIELNVMGKEYIPIVPEAYKKTETIFLANGSPVSHLALLNQMTGPKRVFADTMDFYIQTMRDALLELLPKLDGLILNESEARLLTGESNLLSAARRVLGMGPKSVIVKKGEHGALYVGDDEIFLVPAYPTERVIDPTGAGDSFAGGLLGYLAASDLGDDAAIPHEIMKNGLCLATVTGSFNVEGFSLERFLEITRSDIDQRRETFCAMLCH